MQLMQLLTKLLQIMTQVLIVVAGSGGVAATAPNVGNVRQLATGICQLRRHRFLKIMYIVYIYSYMGRYNMQTNLCSNFVFYIRRVHNTFGNDTIGSVSRFIVVAPLHAIEIQVHWKLHSQLKYSRPLLRCFC